MNQINLINHKTLALVLTLALTLALASTSVLSLRSLRIKIGDYYFEQGKFNQAANWYGKAARKERLNIEQGKGDPIIQYEEDLYKLKSALIREMEGILLNASRILGFGESKDLKSLLTWHKFFSKDVDDLIGVKPREKLPKAKAELVNFNNILSNSKSILGKNIKNGGLDYLVPISHFLKGIIDEAENNFILADSIYEETGASCPEISSLLKERQKKILLNVAGEYFYRSPLNWLKARDLYESHLRSGNANSVDILIKLGYIYAKFNDFSVSYDFFKKACELLKDDELKKTIHHFKVKGAFLYPDDLKMIPRKLIEKYPILQEISFFEAKHLLNIPRVDVKARSDAFIGRTGIKSPVEIIVRSAGKFVGDYGKILINGKNFSQNKVGYNILVLDPKTGVVEKSEGFDTCRSKDDAKKMIIFVNSIEKGKIVCAAVAHEASAQLSLEEGDIFQEIGAKGNLHGKYLWGHGIIGIKGSRCGEAIEAVSEKPIEIYVISQKP